MLRKFNLYFRMFQCFTITKNCHQLDFIPCLHPVITMVLSLLTESAQQFIYYYYFFKYHLLINLRKEKKNFIHLKLLIRDTPRAAATTSRAVTTVLIVVLLWVILGTREAPPTAGSSQRTALQIQVLLAYEQRHTEHLLLWLHCCTYVQIVWSVTEITLFSCFTKW